MKNTVEPNKVKALITFVVVLSVITFSSIGYLIGRGSGDGITTGLTEVEDSSAAVYDNVQKGNVKYTKPQYIPVNEAMPLYFRYTGVNNTNDLPDWKINFCGVVKRFPDTQEVATSRRFTTAGSCKITVNVTVNGKTETVVFYQKVLKVRSNVDADLLTSGDAYVGEDYSVGISLDGKVNASYKAIDWNWSATGDCESAFNLSIETDAVLVINPLNPGFCTVKVVAYVYYDTYAIKAVESTQINILPARVEPTDELEITGTPTPSVRLSISNTPTPSVKLSITNTPTPTAKVYTSVTPKPTPSVSPVPTR